MAKQTKRKAFEPPTLLQVEKYMAEACPDWPTVFVTRIASRFIARYTAVDWKFGGQKMKSWTHAIQAYWLEISHPADRIAYDLAVKDPSHQAKILKRKKQAAGLFASPDEQIENAAKIDLNLNRLTEIQQNVIAGEYDKTALWAEYDLLKRFGIMRIPRQQIDQIMILKGESNERGKSLCVEYLFRNLNHAGLTIKKFYYQIHDHAINNGTVEKTEGKGE